MAPALEQYFFCKAVLFAVPIVTIQTAKTCFSKHISPEEVLKTASKYKAYYNRTGGGVTFSGGEPLLQGEF